jgi:hypothetical protein
MEVTNRQKGIRTVEIIPSTISWIELHQKLARSLDIYPTSLHAQYRLSSDNKDSLPLDLNSWQNLTTLITLLRPLIVPPILANGHRSGRKMKPVTVHLFNKGDSPSSRSDSNVSSEFLSYIYWY